MIIALIPGVSPIFPITSILPLVFVLAVTAVKDAIEDWGRHKSDKAANNAMHQVLRNGQLVDVPSKDIEVGDIIYVVKNKEFPADIVLLSSSLDEGVCYVETSNLDGETNLKGKKAAQGTWGLSNESTLAGFRGSIVAEEPNPHLHDFVARLEMKEGADGKRVVPLSEPQLLLRGARLRNTKHIWGVVVYAGVDTKLFKNLQSKASKFSSLDKKLNKFLLALFVIMIVAVTAAAIASLYLQNDVVVNSWYISALLSSKADGLFVGKNWLTFFVLYNYLIPISLFVTLEVVKALQAKFMEYDDEMKFNGREMRAKTSSLNEELGLVQYVFSDKTGTLTENVMEFYKAWIVGMPDSHDESTNPGGLQPLVSSSESVTEFLRALALCHTVVPDLNEQTGELTYEGQSTDEVALVKAASANGLKLVSRSAKGLEIVVEGTGRREIYQVLAVCQFTPDRKRMSVIVRVPDGSIHLYCKGADSFVLPFVSQSTVRRYWPTMSEKLEDFGREGLRTLVVTTRTIEEAAFAEWLKKFEAAEASIADREAKIARACEEIEQDMDLIGCTAIEDKLQDGVPETIHFLRQAGIAVWVLTGDKRETAINIAYSSRLVDSTMTLLQLVGEDSAQIGDQLTEFLDQTNPEQSVAAASKAPNDAKSKFALVIDGHSLKYVLEDHSKDFMTLARRCESAICCRVTPLQKAMVVQLVQSNLNIIGLSIGDGANDVSMIQQAKVGVGIMGLEGTQAERAADYAIPRFRHLRRLLVVHGRYSLIRNSGLVFFSFYKNSIMFLMQFFYSFTSAFSGQTIFDSYLITFYNIFFTFLPPFAFGLFEKDAPEKALMTAPELYKEVSNGSVFSWLNFVGWLMSGVYHSLVVFLLTKWNLMDFDVFYSTGRTTGLWHSGSIQITAVITIVLLRQGIQMRNLTNMNQLALFLSIVAYYVVALVYTSIPIVVDQGNLYYVIFHILDNINFYLIVLFLTVSALLPDFVLYYVKRQYFPQKWMIHQEKCLVDTKVEKANLHQDVEMTTLS